MGPLERMLRGSWLSWEINAFALLILFLSDIRTATLVHEVIEQRKSHVRMVKQEDGKT